MKNLKTYLTALVFSLAGITVHANAASANHEDSSKICFQLTDLAAKGASSLLTENGFDRTPLGKHLDHLDDGFSRTLQSAQKNLLASDGFNRTPLGQQLNASVKAIQA
jgi:hypothetical protein